jgi:hypothetical protein
MTHPLEPTLSDHFPECNLDAAPLGLLWDSFFVQRLRVSSDFLKERGSQEQAERETI